MRILNTKHNIVNFWEKIEDIFIYIKGMILGRKNFFIKIENFQYMICTAREKQM